MQMVGQPRNFAPISSSSAIPMRALQGLEKTRYTPPGFTFGSKVLLAQAPPPATPQFLETLSQEEKLRLAAKLMIESGQKIASMLSQVYTAYKGTGDWWLAEAAASFFAFGPAGPVGLALDTWWQSSRANQALARLSAARYVGQTWVNSMTDTWLPGFIDGIYEADPALGDQVSSTFDRVVVELNKIYDLTSDIGQLPPRAVTSLVSTFFGSIWSDVKSTGETLHALLAALGQIIREAGALAKTFPTIAVLAITGLAVYLTVK